MILLDTNIFVGYFIARDIYHAQAKQFLESLASERGLVVTPVLPELFYFCKTLADYTTAVRVFTAVRANFEVVPLLGTDMQRMGAVMSTYADARLDFADVSIMAVAERLNITRIATFDRRDFSIYRPVHVAQFTLLP